MNIITTIYLAELEPVEEHSVEEPTEVGARVVDDAGRKWISIYQGKNRVLPLD